MDELFHIMPSTFPAGNALREESFWAQLSPIFYAATCSIDKRDLDARVGRYSSRKKLLIGFMEEEENTVRFAKPRVMLHVWFGVIATSIGAREASREHHYILFTGRCFLLTRKSCSEQCGHDDFEYREGRSGRYL